MIALPVLLALLVAAAASGGTLRVEAESPLGPVSYAARVLDAKGALAAMARLGESTPELVAGSYRVELLTDPPLARAGVAVKSAGETVVRFTELGGLRLRVSGADGAPLRTAADILLLDGRRLTSIGAGDAGETLPAGTYKVVLRTNPNRTFERVEIRPGRIEELRAGTAATLTVEVRGVGGAAVAAPARLRHPDGSDLVLESGESLTLPPGRYDVLVDTVPPVLRAVTLESGRGSRVVIDDLGALVFDLRDPSGSLARTTVTLLDPASGLVLATAVNGDTLAVRPGTYRVRFDGGAGAPGIVHDGVQVTARRATRVGRAGRRG